MRKKWEIWSEGHAVADGEARVCGEAKATFHGEIEADSFQEACDKFFADDEYYRSENLHYWVCKLFDNETDARKSWG